MTAAPMGSQNYESAQVSGQAKLKVDPVSRIYIPEDSFIRGREDGGELFNQMGSVARFLQLVNHTDDNVVVDTIRIYLGTALGAWRRWWGMVVGRPSAAFWSLGEGDILGGREGRRSRSRC